ncbi:NAD(P)/FAD-dependent oxidoreductase [Nocardiopsis quinghaiensis]|uniref:NAD(P)/FAD-dependent oxidoreductase n=1 Tax=Nocardiopsis quinghaiensis TaxID=464995 RepID=UPI00123960CB|nr:NAD(P)/FAD-dependent oxidoreductase [Nocardiopsis quinghaiensis]
MYDVIVVGARCAGSPTAMLLARKGHRVLVLDRASFPSDTVSTHYLHQTALLRLQDWGLLDPVVKSGAPAIRKMHFAFQGIELNGFAAPVDGIDAVYCPRRTVLDDILLNGAREAGCEVVENFSVTDLVFSEGRVVGVRGREGKGQERELLAQVVVGADGFHSTVAKRAGAQTYDVRPAANFIYYSYYSGLDWGLHHKTGHNRRWIGTWPTNDGLTMLAVICNRSHLKEFRQDAENQFLATFDDVVPEMGEELRAKGHREEPFRPMRNPDNYYRTAHGPGWALVGDAGYHKDPFTGWGMADAFIHAEMLADRLHEGLSGKRPVDEALADYAAARDEESAPVYDFTCTLAELELPPFYKAVMGAISQDQKWTDTMLGIIAGLVHGDEIFSPESLQKLYDETGVPEEERVYDPSA